MNNANNSEIRTKKLRNNAIQMYIYRAGGIMVNFLYVPLLIDSLSVDNYGIWLTITSIVAMMSFFDVGLGNGMRNKVAESLALGDEFKAREYVSTTYFLLSLVATGLIALILLVVPQLDWKSLLNAPSADSRELSLLITFVFVFFVIQLVLNLVSVLFSAIQSPAKSSMVTFLSQLSGLVMVFVLNKVFGTDSLLTYGIAISISPIVVLVILSLFFYLGKLSYISPSIKLINLKYGKNVVNKGFQYFLIQLTAILLFGSNNFIIAHCIDVASVVDYNVAFKYMHVPLMLYTILTGPIWSATTDAYASGDYAWIRGTISKMQKIAFLLDGLLVLMILVSPIVYKIWVGDALQVNWWLLILLGVYQVFSIQTALFCSVINGIGKIRLQFYICLFEAVLHIPFAVYMAQYIGIYAVAISLTVMTVFNALWEPVQINLILNKKANGIWNK